ncbi:hypothetical protein AKO1_008186 [Acrasis kona]|uniref:EF-hand domain-containing protein n=1 Tax=Acrasis kona TaxID=1008807 RepID=A0AAW2YMU6_9EUKA
MSEADNVAAICEVPDDVRSKIFLALEMVDVDKDNKISYYEFLYSLTELRNYRGLECISGDDVRTASPFDEKQYMKELLPVDMCWNWAATIYINKHIEGSGEQDLTSESTESDVDLRTECSNWDLNEVTKQVFGDRFDMANSSTSALNTKNSLVAVPSEINTSPCFTSDDPFNNDHATSPTATSPTSKKKELGVKQKIIQKFKNAYDSSSTIH